MGECMAEAARARCEEAPVRQVSAWLRPRKWLHGCMWFGVALVGALTWCCRAVQVVAPHYACSQGVQDAVQQCHGCLKLMVAFWKKSFDGGNEDKVLLHIPCGRP